MIKRVNSNAFPKLGISWLQFNLLLSLSYTPTTEEIDALIARGFLEQDEDGEYFLSAEGKHFVDKMTYKVKGTRTSDDTPLLAKAMRELFPRGMKEGRFAWRGTMSEITRKLLLFKSENPEYTNDQILEATRKYVKNYENNKTYMQLLKYFILKNGNSTLLEYLENLEDIQEAAKEDWASQVK